MFENNKTDLYLDHLKNYILPFIDYSELQQSYETDMVYAKGVLNRLHSTMGLIYGGETLTSMEGDVVVPGIIRGKESGKLCLALLTLDMSSSGEHPLTMVGFLVYSFHAENLLSWPVVLSTSVYHIGSLFPFFLGTYVLYLNRILYFALEYSTSIYGVFTTNIQRRLPIG